MQLRPNNKQWYDHIVKLSERAQDQEALMFLQQRVLSAYKYVIQKSKTIIACFQVLETLCINEGMHAEATAAKGNPKSFPGDEAINKNGSKSGGYKKNTGVERKKLPCKAYK